MSLLSTFKALALALPGSWSFVPYPHEHHTDETRGYLKRADGLTLWLIANGYNSKGKVVISLDAPRDSKGHHFELYNEAPATGTTPVPSIKVSDTKTAEQIARDISNRLLPDAESYFKRASDRIAGWNDQDAKKRATLQAICKAAGVEAQDDWRNKGEPRYEFDVQTSLGRVAVYVSGADSVRLTLDTTSGNALKFLGAFTKKA